MYYLFIALSVLMFGACFALTDAYQKVRSGSLKSSLENGFVGAAAGLFVLLLISGFELKTTPFTLLMATLLAINGIAFTFFSFQALGRTNLSLYALFSMLGGMVLPFFQGILFYNETVSLAKVICFVLVCVALSLTVSKKKKRGGAPYYIGIFVLNGVSGVISKFFTAAPWEKGSAINFSIWVAIITALITGISLLFFHAKQEKRPPYSWQAFAISAGNGVLNRVANLLLMLALVHVDASLQYPMVTGGIIMISTLISALGGARPSKKEFGAVIVAFLGTLALFLIKI